MRARGHCRYRLRVASAADQTQTSCSPASSCADLASAWDGASGLGWGREHLPTLSQRPKNAAILNQKIFLGRVRIKLAQDEGHTKGPKTVFPSRWGPRKSHKKWTSKNVTRNEKSSVWKCGNAAIFNRKRPDPAKNATSKKHGFSGHSQIEKSMVNIVTLSAEGAIFERAFCWLHFSQRRGGSNLIGYTKILRFVCKTCSKTCGLHFAVGQRNGFSWKSGFPNRYRPEGLFRFFGAWFWNPPGRSASTAKKGKFIGTGHFSPHCMAFLEKGGGLVYVILFPVFCDCHFGTLKHIVISAGQKPVAMPSTC